MNPKPDMKIRVAPPRHGIAWLVQSVALIRAQPGGLLLIAVLLLFLMILTQVRWLGLLLNLSVPALVAGVLLAFHVTAMGGRTSPVLLFTPLFSGTHTGRLLSLGVLMFAVFVLTASLFLSGNAAMLDPDLIARIEQGDIEALSALDQGTLVRMVMAFLIGMSASGTLIYLAIPLIWFHDLKLGAALAGGLKALIINWKPFLVLGLGLGAVLMLVLLLSGILVTLASGAGVLSIIPMGMVMILLLAFQLILFGSQYCAFRGIFGLGSESEPAAGADDNQLLA